LETKDTDSRPIERDRRRGFRASKGTRRREFDSIRLDICVLNMRQNSDCGILVMI
jgi:hypothetical protein